jgi:methylated-DNA-[protein]-cysteine S-methyltransferase
LVYLHVLWIRPGVAMTVRNLTPLNSVCLCAANPKFLLSYCAAMVATTAMTAFTSSLKTVPAAKARKAPMPKAHGPPATGLLDFSEQGRCLSVFRRRVFEALLLVPPGNVTTYQMLGKHINCASPRAIGQALKHNPLAPRVPCHRVVAASLRLGGFHGHVDGPYLQKKVDLLLSEGVKFLQEDSRNDIERSLGNEGGKGVVYNSSLRVDPSCLYNFN